MDTRKDFNELEEPDYINRLADKERELSGMSVDGLLDSDEENFNIAISEIAKVTLSKHRFIRGRYIKIETRQKKYCWLGMGVPPIIKVADLINLLRYCNRFLWRN